MGLIAAVNLTFFPSDRRASRSRWRNEDVEFPRNFRSRDTDRPSTADLDSLRGKTFWNGDEITDDNAMSITMTMSFPMMITMKLPMTMNLPMTIKLPMVMNLSMTMKFPMAMKIPMTKLPMKMKFPMAINLPMAMILSMINDHSLHRLPKQQSSGFVDDSLGCSYGPRQEKAFRGRNYHHLT